MIIPNIIDLMKKSCNYSLSYRSASWLAEIAEEDLDTTWVIVPEDYVAIQRPEMSALKEKYSIMAVCELGDIYIEAGTKMVLIGFTKENSRRVVFSVYHGSVYSSKRVSDSEKGSITILVERFTDPYKMYIEALTKKFSGVDIKVNDAEINTVGVNDIDFEHLYPKYYTQKAIAIRNFIQKEQTVDLCEIADVIRPTVNRDGVKGKCITYRDMRYPLDELSLNDRDITDVKLQKGDILFTEVSNCLPYLFQGSSSDIYASHTLIVIRPHSILPEYLFLYLSSDTAKTIFESNSLGSYFCNLTSQRIKKFPIVLPKYDDQKYIKDFEAITAFDRRIYNKDQIERLGTYYEHIYRLINDKEKPENIEDILNIELANTIKVHNEEQLRTFLTDDLKELNICFKNKAYKAALILAGSILEAVLIDWLSEINGVDYFEHDFMVKDRNGRNKRADLIDYINEIKEIERPNWMEEANKAHEIRKKRNLVHAKLCISTDAINENVCREVIGYLGDVLKTRGIK